MVPQLRSAALGLSIDDGVNLLQGHQAGFGLT